MADPAKPFKAGCLSGRPFDSFLLYHFQFKLYLSKMSVQAASNSFLVHYTSMSHGHIINILRTYFFLIDSISLSYIGSHLTGIGFDFECIRNIKPHHSVDIRTNYSHIVQLKICDTTHARKANAFCNPCYQ